MDLEVVLTPEGYNNLKTELEERKNEKREKLKLEIEEMRAKGDLSENDGYTLALEDYQSNEKIIMEIEAKLANAKIVKKNPNAQAVHVSSIVLVQSGDQKIEYTVVGDTEADPISNKISLSSPIGSALMGKKVGDEVIIKLPKGDTKYKILSID